MALLYGRAGHLTSQNGGFRPGQCTVEERALCDANASCESVSTGGADCTCNGGYSGDGTSNNVGCLDTNGSADSPCTAGVACFDVAAPGTGFTCEGAGAGGPETGRR